MAVTLKDIKQAQTAIQPYAKHTPLQKSQTLSDLTGAEVFLKLENLQVTSSFKVRGAINRLLNLTAEQKKQGRQAA